jgi:hypothetical protein
MNDVRASRAPPAAASAARTSPALSAAAIRPMPARCVQRMPVPPDDRSTASPTKRGGTCSTPRASPSSFPSRSPRGRECGPIRGRRGLADWRTGSVGAGRHSPEAPSESEERAVDDRPAAAPEVVVVIGVPLRDAMAGAKLERGRPRTSGARPGRAVGAPASAASAAIGPAPASPGGRTTAPRTAAPARPPRLVTMHGAGSETGATGPAPCDRRAIVRSARTGRFRHQKALGRHGGWVRPSSQKELLCRRFASRSGDGIEPSKRRAAPPCRF